MIIIEAIKHLHLHCKCKEKGGMLHQGFWKGSKNFNSKSPLANNAMAILESSADAKVYQTNNDICTTLVT